VKQIPLTALGGPDYNSVNLSSDIERM